MVALTVPVERSTTETLAAAPALLAVTARFRRGSTATLVGAVPTEMSLVFCRYVALVGARSISEMELDPLFATTAIPVAVLMATQFGVVPTPSVVRTTGGSVGETAKLLAVI